MSGPQKNVYTAISESGETFEVTIETPPSYARLSLGRRPGGSRQILAQFFDANGAGVGHGMFDLPDGYDMENRGIYALARSVPCVLIEFERVGAGERRRTDAYIARIAER